MVENKNNRVSKRSSKIAHPITFHGSFAELEQIIGFKKFTINFCRILADGITKNDLTAPEIELLYLTISRDIRKCLINKGDRMSLLDEIINEIPEEVTDGDAIIEFFRKMQISENSKNKDFWENPEIKPLIIRLKSSEYILKVLIKSPISSYVCCLSKDLLGNTFHMVLFSISGTNENIYLNQKSKIIIFDDLNGEKKAESKDVITKFVVKLKELINRLN